MRIVFARLLSVIAAALWYPAITLPMLTFQQFGRRTDTGLLTGIEKLQDGGYVVLSYILLAASVVFPAVKCTVLMLDSFFPDAGTATGVFGRTFRVFRQVLRIPARYSMVDIFVITVVLIALSGPYGIKVSLNLGFWIFVTMVVSMLAASVLFQRTPSKELRHA